MTNISLSHFQSAAESAAISGNLNQKLTVTDGGDLQTREASSTLAGKLVSWHKLSSSEGTAKAQDQGAFRTALQDKFGKELGDQAYKHACTACGYTDGKAHSLTAEQITTGIDFAVTKDLQKQLAEAQNKGIVEHFEENPELLLSEGVTRKSGKKTEIEGLIANRKAEGFDGICEHTLAGVFKQNLRDNLTDTESAKVLDFVKAYDPKLSNLPALNELPDSVQGAVKLSKMVLGHQEENRMNANNIGIVFGPNIAKDDGIDPMAALTLNQAKTQFFTALINRAD
ncbi:RhoGAP domain protein [Pseudovibrio sp. Ad13]|uniref:RhoGAP domain-containing protein n=1 Tax=Pseudovibrio sp. Ad13 TaxID=989396 RepID=UPI0007AECDB1|nr:RhoGAP domain-containing protein [Pseudovibrio sp. Ad13]KZK86183.1 RhoGAP domain protein [Pseudovibrio sp. Ad13]